MKVKMIVILVCITCLFGACDLVPYELTPEWTLNFTNESQEDVTVRIYQVREFASTLLKKEVLASGETYTHTMHAWVPSIHVDHEPGSDTMMQRVQYTARDELQYTYKEYDAE